MKTLLVGELDPETAALVGSTFDPLLESYGRRSVPHLEALKGLLDPLQGDLLILDLEAHGSAALDWLGEIARKQISIPVVAMGAAEAPDLSEYTKRYPHLYFPQITYLRKPVLGDKLLEAVSVELSDTAWGVIGGLSLSSLLQMLHLERKTCTIRVVSGRRQGFFYLRSGEIINARYRNAEGLQAAYMLLASDSPHSEIDGLLHDSTQKITASLEEILMESARLQDERVEPAKHAEESSVYDLPRSEAGKWKPLNPPKTSMPASAPVPPVRRRGLYGAVAAILMIGAAGYFLLPRKQPLEVLSSPSGAIVKLDGQPLGQTPLHLQLPKLQGRLTLELAGHVPQLHEIQRSDQHLQFALQPLPVPEPPLEATEAEPDPEAPIVGPSKPSARNKPKPRTPPKSAPKSKRDIFDQVR